MVIAESKIGFGSTHVLTESYQQTQSLKVWVGDKRPHFAGEPAAKGGGSGDQVQLSGKTPAPAPAGGSQAAADTEPEDAGLDPRYLMLKQLVERLFHTKIHLYHTQSAQGGQGQGESGTPRGQAQAKPAGYGIEYDQTESVRETESTSFAAGGVIKTADGQEINFKLNLDMSRSYQSEESTSLRAGDAVPVLKDPLVLNFNGSAAELSSTRFSFDLNADGKNEQVATLGANSAYLALDKNGDGTINNGSELFGARTGNGFAELAAYDSDGNGWIDEKDAVYSQLKTWSGGAGGEGSLQGLKAAGVGAIYLGSQATPFSLKSGDNALLGAVKASGVFLNENGSVGSMQQIDLAV